MDSILNSWNIESRFSPAFHIKGKYGANGGIPGVNFLYLKYKFRDDTLEYFKWHKSFHKRVS